MAPPRRSRLAFRAALFSIAAVTLASPARAQFALPPDFVDDLMIGGLSQPVSMAFLPDGRLLFVERATARIRLLVNGALAASDPVITVPNVSSTGTEQGLLGIAVDPGWPVRPYLYIHYDYTGSATIRLSRFTVAGDLSFTGNGSLTIDPATRYDILTDVPDVRSNHNGGTLRFGPDGMLYNSLGDDASGCPAQDLTVLAGKILRLDVSGLPAGGGGPPAKSLITPSDNPFVTDPNANARLVCHWGLRNPFRFGIDPETGGMVIGDVGEGSQEELDYATVTGRNFQWPIYEGNLMGPMSCTGVDSITFSDPIHVYSHAAGRAVIGGAIYRRPASAANRFPPEYDGDIFFSDFYSSWVRRLKGSGNTWSLEPSPGQPNATDWGSGGTWISDWLVSPDGALWYCRMLSGSGSGPGQLRRIRYTGTVSVSGPSLSGVEFRAPFPSPSTGNVSFEYGLPTEAPVALVIYDLGGRQVRTLVAPQVQTAGPQRVTWDGHDERGRPLAPGIYLARLIVAGHSFERRLVLAH